MCRTLGANIAKVCTNTQGGNSKLYVFGFVQDAFTVTDGVATAINADLTVVYQYDIRQSDGNTFTQSGVGDAKTGTKLNTQTLVAQLKKITGATNNEAEALLESQWQGVIVDRNGNAHAIGLDEGFTNVTVEAVTGAAKTDFNGYNITAVAETKNLAPVLDSTTLTALEALIYEP